jgi:Holliday junction DNA helicase RuvA
MLAYINGRIIARDGNQIIVKLPAGMGYLVNVSLKKNYLQNENGELFLLEIKREDRNELFGFDNLEEKNWCEKLMKVSGVGPKMAANVVFSLGVNQILDALQIGDPKPFSEVKGLGGKTAKKIVLELKGETVDLKELDKKSEQGSYFTQEFVDTLSGIGYKRGEIVAVISNLTKEGQWNEADIVETVRFGLKHLGRG